MNPVKFLISLFFAAAIFGTVSLMGQTGEVVFGFKKGEVMDILFLTQKAGTGTLFKDYAKTAFPVAENRSYKALTGFKVNENLQGNYQPESMILSKWDNIKEREGFLSEIESFVPDFHERRRSIWSSFCLTYYEMPADISFTVTKGKFNVVTAYWQSNKKAFDKFKREWLSKVKKGGGSIKLIVQEGKSPLGYFYQPEILVITEWESKEAFDKFYSQSVEMSHKGVKHVNQFLLNY